MANVTISYTPKRQLIDPPPSTDFPLDPPLVLDVTQFEPEYETSTSEAMSKSGRMQASLYYDTLKYNVSVVPDSVSREDMEMFLASVMVKEEFTITNPNENDRVMTVQLIGRGSRQRFSISGLDRWNYSFAVREVTG